MSANTFAMTRKLIVALPLTLALGACDWFTDFKNQPRVEPWEPLSQMDNDTVHAPRGNPANSVPVTGRVAPGYQYGYGPNPAWLDSMARIANPTPASAASLTNGRKYYTINCAVCHGLTGMGDGTATKYGFPGIALVNESAKGRSDGYIFGMIRNGRGLMPTYDRIEEMDRWDVVNYVRALQGSTPNTTGDTKPYGMPGQNGQNVPGATHTAPTLPAPYRPNAATAAATPPAAPAAPAAPTDSATETKRGTP